MTCLWDGCSKEATTVRAVRGNFSSDLVPTCEIHGGPMYWMSEGD